MIDLHHLLNNIDLYNNKYKKKGLKTNVKFFIMLENVRKQLQQKTENMRALCNKLCGEVVKLKNNGKSTEDLVEKITLLDKQINKNNEILNKQNLYINKKLKKLHNLPDYLNPMHEQMKTNKSGVEKKQLIDLLEKQYNIIEYPKNIKKLFKEKRNYLLDEQNLPLVTKCKDGYLFFCTEAQQKEIQEQFLDYFSTNALSLIKVSCRKLNKENSASFYVHMNRRESFYFEINKEFYSREYNIKYKDTKTDMTKFVNQINILFKW